MKKPSTRIVLTNNLDRIISLSRNMKRETGTMKFSTTDGDKKVLSLDKMFSTRELTLRCYKTDNNPPMTHHCKFDNAFDLSPLVQYFSWNDDANAILRLGDLDFPDQKEQLRVFDSLENIDEKVYFTVSENPNHDSISVFFESDTMYVGAIIDFIKGNKDKKPFPYKIFGMNCSKKERIDGKGLQIFYTSPQEGHECFDLALSLIEKYST